MRPRYRAWVIRLSVMVILLSILVILSSRNSSLPPPSTAPSQATSVIDSSVIHKTWRDSVTQILAVYDDALDAQAALEALTLLVVSSQDQDAHLALVLAMQAIVDERDDAVKRLTSARQMLLAKP